MDTPLSRIKSVDQSMPTAPGRDDDIRSDRWSENSKKMRKNVNTLRPDCLVCEGLDQGIS